MQTKLKLSAEEVTNAISTFVQSKFKGFDIQVNAFNLDHDGSALIDGELSPKVRGPRKPRTPKAPQDQAAHKPAKK